MIYKYYDNKEEIMSKGIFNTEELLCGYFETKPATTVRKIRSQIDRPELYEYERKLNKPLVHMDVLEIADMLLTFTNANYKDRKYKMSYRTYDAVISNLRGFFEWYIDNVEVIKNPCNDKRIKGINKTEIIKDVNEVFTKEKMEELITNIRNDSLEENADYIEAIIRMYYEGFSESRDIVSMKCDDVNHDERSVFVRGRKIMLSDRLYSLLVKIHDMAEFPAYRGNYVMVSYNDSYFKFPTRERYKDEDRDIEFYIGYISRVLIKELKTKRHLNINARTFYLLGFYNFIQEKAGKEHSKELITAYKNSEYADEIAQYAAAYNLAESNTTAIKGMLLPFVE